MSKRFFLLVCLFCLNFNLVFSMFFFDDDKNDIFDVNILEISQKDNDYFVLVEIENKLDRNLNFDVEIIYDKENLVVSNKRFSCKEKCVKKFKLRKVFFDSYEVVVTSKFRGKRYVEVESFEIELPKLEYDVEFKPYYIIENGVLNLSGVILKNRKGEDNFYFEVYSEKLKNDVVGYDVICSEVKCEFSLVLSSKLFAGNYFVDVYSNLGNVEKEVKVYFETDLIEIEEKKVKEYEDLFEDIWFWESEQGLVLSYDEEGDVFSNLEFDFDGLSFSQNLNKNKFKYFSLFGDEFFEMLRHRGRDFKSGLNYVYLKEKVCDEQSLDLFDEMNSNCRFVVLRVLEEFDFNNLFYVSRMPVKVEMGKRFVFEIRVFDEDYVKYLVLPEGFRIVDILEDGRVEIGGVLMSEENEVVILDVFGNKKRVKFNVGKPWEILELQRSLEVDEVEVDYENESVILKIEKEDVRIEFENLSNFSEVKKFEIYKKSDADDDLKVKVESLSQDILTEIVNVEALNFTTAKVSLSKVGVGDVLGVLMCSNFLAGSCLGVWEEIDVVLSENETHVSFNVTHFSAYTGIGVGYEFDNDFTSLADVVIEKDANKTIVVNVSCLNVGNCGSLNVSLHSEYFFNNTEDFEVDFGFWNIDGGVCDWRRNQDVTPSFGTGPGGNSAGAGFDHTLGTSSGWYVYVETSSSNCQGADTSAILTSDVFKAGSLNTSVSFWYHTIGSSVGTFSVDVFDGGVWVNDVWTISGAQQATVDSPYNYVFLNLENFSNSQDMQIRFRYFGVTGWQADFALDDITILADGKLISNLTGSTPLKVIGAYEKVINLNQNQNSLVLFNLNATGNVSDEVMIFPITRSFNNRNIESKGDLRRVIISDFTPPSGVKLSPVSGFFYNNVNVSFRANASDNLGLRDAKLYIWDENLNLFDIVLIDLNNSLQTEFVFEYNFTQSGIFYWNVEVSDYFNNSVFLGSNWSLNLSFPYVNVEYIGNFSNPFLANQYKFTPLVLNVSCRGGDCGGVEVDLLYEYFNQTYLYFENFETGLGSWVNLVGDDRDWTRDSGGTPSSGTGPSVDHTLGTSAGWYVYYETSSPVTAGEISLFESPLFNSREIVNFEFWYHMLGTSLGTLELEFLNGSSWTKLFTISGSQGDVWHNQSFSFNYVGDTKFRFRGIRGSSWSSDIALDDLNISVEDKVFVDVSSLPASLPMWVNSSNPVSFNLNDNESRIVIFYINATGDVFDRYLMQARASVVSGIGSGMSADKFNLSITEAVPPFGVKVSPANNSFFSTRQVSFVANVSDNDELDRIYFYLYDELNNEIYSDFKDLTGLNFSQVTFNYEFLKNGNYSWNMLVYDKSQNYYWLDGGDRWRVEVVFPNIAIEFLDLNSTYYFTPNSSKLIRVNVTCEGGDCGLVNLSFFYYDNLSMFEDFEVSFGNYSVDGGTCSWTRNQDVTPSSGTGPGGNTAGAGFDHTLGTSTGWYSYVETSSSNCQGADLVAELTSSVFKNDLKSASVSFWYHTVGSSVGNFFVDVFDGVNWNLGVFSLSGAQQSNVNDPYFFGDVDLSNFGVNLQFKFRYTDVTGWQADFALDDLNITYLGEVKVLESVANPMWINNSNLKQVTLNNGDSSIVEFNVNVTAGVGSEYVVKVAGISNLNPSIYGRSEFRNISVVNLYDEGVNLSLKQTILRVGNNLFEVNLNLSNLGNFQTPIGSDLYVYVFLSNFSNLSSPFIFSNSSFYSSSYFNYSVFDSGFVGDIYVFNISASNPSMGVFDVFNQSSNLNNSWQVKFNVSAIGNFKFSDLILTGFDPVK